MSATEIVNWGEVFLWPAIGLLCLVFAIKRKRRADKSLWVLGATFILFGLSDFIELKTGAWWTPLWLLFLNAFCIAIFVTIGVRHLRRTSRSGVSKDRSSTVSDQCDEVAEDEV